jgi:O-antigen/teichoic acid export membrane protein
VRSTLITAEAPLGTGRRTSLGTGFAWTLAGNVVYAASQWGILVAIAKFAPPDAVGRFALGLAVAAPVFLLTGLQLRGVQATDAAGQFRFEDYLAVRIVGVFLALSLTTAIALGGYDRATAAIIFAVSVSKVLEGLSDVYYGLLQQHDRMRSVSVSLIARGLLSVASITAVLWLGAGLLWAVFAMAASWLIVLVAHDVRVGHNTLGPAAVPRTARVRWTATRRIVFLALPLGGVLALISLRSNIPRYFLEKHVGSVDLGIFAALSSAVAAGYVAISALGQAAAPRLARLYLERNTVGFTRLVIRMVAFGAAVGMAGLLAAAVVGRPVVTVLFGAAYALHNEVLLWLLAGATVAYASSFLGFALTAARKFRVQLPLFLSTTLVCTAASAFLVPRHGLVGAAWAWGVALLVEFVASGALCFIAIREVAETK